MLPLVRPLSARKTVTCALGGHLQNAIAGDVAEEDVSRIVGGGPFEEADQCRDRGRRAWFNESGRDGNLRQVVGALR